MPIDRCEKSFDQLATTVLPRYLQDMRLALKQPKPLADFRRPRVGVRTILKELQKDDDFSGCYVFVDRDKPFYVGISRGVVARLRQHVTGKTCFDATLAYSIARDKVPHQSTGTAAMKDEQFRQAFNAARRFLADSSVAFIEIENPLELYLFEAYCAMALDTCKWNTFRTH